MNDERSAACIRMSDACYAAMAVMRHGVMGRWMNAGDSEVMQTPRSATVCHGEALFMGERAERVARPRCRAGYVGHRQMRTAQHWRLLRYRRRVHTSRSTYYDGVEA